MIALVRWSLGGFHVRWSAPSPPLGVATLEVVGSGTPIGSLGG